MVSRRGNSLSGMDLRIAPTRATPTVCVQFGLFSYLIIYNSAALGVGFYFLKMALHTDLPVYRDTYKLVSLKRQSVLADLMNSIGKQVVGWKNSATSNARIV